MTSAQNDENDGIEFTIKCTWTVQPSPRQRSVGGKEMFYTSTLKSHCIGFWMCYTLYLRDCQ